MTPQLLLSLWRERWGKSFSKAFMLPPASGKLNQWGDQLVHAPAWAYPGPTMVAWITCIFLLMFTLPIEFSLGGQVAFAILIMGITAYIRRYRGTLIFLILLGLSFFVSTRYFYWRFTSTLSHSSKMDFILGFCLCVVELYLWFMLLCGAIKKICPITTAQIPLSNDTNEWPTVDVFILSQGLSRTTVEQATLSALAFDWPKKKIGIKILDDISREDIQELAQTLGVKYGAYPDNTSEKSGCINLALSETSGELLAIFDGTQTFDKNFLQVVSGWFIQNASLGMLQTPFHFLAPKPSIRSLEILNASETDISIALFRRSMLLEVNGLHDGPVSTKMHTALKLQNSGYTHAYFNLKTSVIAEAIKLDHPFLGKTLFWKQCLHALETALRFYSPIIWIALTTTPLTYMFFEAHMVRTSMELFAAFALPHLLLAHIIYAKLQGAPRLTVFAGMREVMLSFYMLLRTSVSFIVTELGNSRNLFRPKKDTERTLPLIFENTTVFSYCVTLFIHVAGLTLGLIRWFFSNAQPDVFAPLYFSWSAYNLMLLLAMLAVAKESRLIHWKSRQHLQMPAMIKFANGRSTSCMTENFPAQVLELRLPSDVIVEPQSAVIVSIFRGPQEFALASQVVSQQERVLRVVMQDLARDDYRTLGSAVYSRDKNWPKWLPGRNADQLPPLWVVRILRKIQKTALLLLSRLDIFPKLQQFSLWIQRWKKKL